MMPTSYEIYQTYLRGPAAVLRLFEQSLGTQAIYGSPDPDMQQRAIEGLSEEVGRLKSQIARLKQELSEARGNNHQLGGATRNSKCSTRRTLITPRAAVD